MPGRTLVLALAATTALTSVAGWGRAPAANVQPTGVALAVAAFFGLAYLTVWGLTAMGRDLR